LQEEKKLNLGRDAVGKEASLLSQASPLLGLSSLMSLLRNSDNHAMINQLD
jgi:hypothetical protein